MIDVKKIFKSGWEKIDYCSFPIAGSFLGVAGAAMYRLWKGIPFHVKMPSKQVVVLFPAINAPMQVIFTGPLKYGIMVLPLIPKLTIAIYQSWKQKEITPLKQEVFSKEVVFIIANVAMTLFVVFTHSYWAIAAVRGSSSLTDLSDHVLVVFSCASVFSYTLHNLIGKMSSVQKHVFFVISLLFGVSSCIFLLNTCLYFHATMETIAALGGALSILGLSYKIAKCIE